MTTRTGLTVRGTQHRSKCRIDIRRRNALDVLPSLYSLRKQRTQRVQGDPA